MTLSNDRHIHRDRHHPHALRDPLDTKATSAVTGRYRANQIGRDDVVDMSGDGKISDLELRHEREAAGRKYVIEDFVQRNRNIIHEFNPLYKRMSHWEQRDDLMHEFKDSVSFADVFKASAVYSFTCLPGG